jgi:hypothetical protein
VASYFTEDTIDVKTAARARAARLAAAAKENPEFNLTSDGVNFSLIESALYLSVFNNGSSSTAVTEWVKVMFRESDSVDLLHTIHSSSADLRIIQRRRGFLLRRVSPGRRAL